MSTDDKSQGELIRAKEKNPKQSDFFPAELIALERERITSQDKRTDVARAAIEAQKEADKRQYDYHMTRLTNEENDSRRKFTFASKISWAIFGISVITFLFLMGNAFYGDPTKSALAMQILRLLAHLGAGAGMFILARYGWKKLFNDGSSES